MAAIVLTRSSSMTNVRELICLPDAFYGRDYINVTNPLASGLMTSATILPRPYGLQSRAVPLTTRDKLAACRTRSKRSLFAAGIITDSISVVTSK